MRVHLGFARIRVHNVMHVPCDRVHTGIQSRMKGGSETGYNITFSLLTILSRVILIRLHDRIALIKKRFACQLLKKKKKST